MTIHSTFLAATLGLPTSWTVQEVRLRTNNTSNILEIRVRTIPHASFTCPLCGAESSVQSESEETWHHPSFLFKATRIHASIPYIHCSSGCGLQRIPPPWQYPESHFTQKTE